MPQQPETPLSPEDTRVLAGLYLWHRAQEGRGTVSSEPLPTGLEERRSYLLSIAPEDPREYFGGGQATLSMEEARRVSQGEDLWPGMLETATPASLEVLSLEDSPGWRHDLGETPQEYFERTGNRVGLAEQQFVGQLKGAGRIFRGVGRAIGGVWDTFAGAGRSTVASVPTPENPPGYDAARDAIGRQFSEIGDRRQRLREDVLARVRETPAYQDGWLDARDAADEAGRVSGYGLEGEVPITRPDRLVQQAYPTFIQEYTPLALPMVGPWGDPTETEGYQRRLGTLEGQQTWERTNAHHHRRLGIGTGETNE